MVQPLRVLMATWDGGGNAPPLRALLRSLIARGHTAHVLAHDVQRELFEGDGATFEPLSSVRQIDSAEPGIDATLFQDVVLAEGMGADLQAAIERLRPDVLLIDSMLLDSVRTANASGLPTVLLVHSLYGFLEVIVGQMGLPLDLNGSDLALAFSYRAFDPVASRPANLVHVGPLRP